MELAEIEANLSGLTPVVQPPPSRRKRSPAEEMARVDRIANRSREFQHILEAEKCDPAVIVARMALGRVTCTECNGKGRLRYRRQRCGKLVFDPDPKAPKTVGVVACLSCKGSGKQPVETNQMLSAAIALLPYRFPRLKHMEHVRANVNLSGSLSVVELASMLSRIPEEGGQLLPPPDPQAPKPLPEGDL